mgnify:CR=1 FL=1
MCGIIGCVGVHRPVDVLVNALENLEYRGYDSAGVALQHGSAVGVHKREGEVEELADGVSNVTTAGDVGIGHTRWSTHGEPSDANAHPHTDCSGRIAVVHNGIIDNYDELRADLAAAGHEFASQTDTEVIPHLVERYREETDSIGAAFDRALEDVTGSFAIAMLVRGEDAIYAARSGSPLVLGVADDAYYLASDVPAFLEYTDEVIYLEDGDRIRIDPEGHSITDANGSAVDRPVERVDWVAEDAQKGQYEHFMLKEIHEQPTALRQAIQGRIDPDGSVTFEDADLSPLADASSIHFVACGTSYHAAMYGAQMLSDRGFLTRTSLASEFVANPPPIDEDAVVVGVTQSGETADTLAALDAARATGATTMAVTNVVGSTAARDCAESIFIRAGPEIGVAATKTFSSQVATLALLAEYLAPDTDEALLEGLAALPTRVETILDGTAAADVATEFSEGDAYFFIGRGTAHSVALEGALKLKEISYEHAEGFPAGELKHGPLALVTPQTPVFAIDTGRHRAELRGNVEEVQARDAPVVAIAPPESPVAETSDRFLPIPDAHPALAGIMANVQLQLVSYHTARLLDRAIDKPRNLAKSVTVQ